MKRDPRVPNSLVQPQRPNSRYPPPQYLLEIVSQRGSRTLFPRFHMVSRSVANAPQLGPFQSGSPTKLKGLRDGREVPPLRVFETSKTHSVQHERYH